MNVTIPPVGESISEVTVGQWLKADGDPVSQDELICELESEKASFELRAEVAGQLQHKAKEGDTVAVGAVIATITAQTGAPHTPQPAVIPVASSATMEPPATPQDVLIPSVGESISEVILASWLKAEDAEVEVDEPVAELESEKASFELVAPIAGTLKQVVKAGDTLPIGTVVCRIFPAAGGSAPVASSTATPSYAIHHPSPAAAKTLDEAGISPAKVQGSGPKGRITQADAKQAVAAAATTATTPTATEQVAPPVVTSLRKERKERLSTLRKTIARRLVQVKNETAMLTTFNEVNMQPVMELRKRYKASFHKKYEVGLGFMSFFTKAACMALQELPAINAQITDGSILYHEYCDISIAVSTPKGLVVPVIRDADKLRFDEVEKEIVRLATRARAGKISLQEMSGGTFTITNGGIFGSLLSTPIINAPQSAILGMHNIVERPVVVNKEIIARPMMYIALSYDHRIIDGRESVTFLVRLKELLEDPTRLLLGV